MIPFVERLKHRLLGQRRFGRSFFVIDKVVDPGLLQTLREDIVPRLLREVPAQPSQEQLDSDPFLCRFILVKVR